MTTERRNPGDPHFQTPWWAGYNDARAGRSYDNWRTLQTSRFEYDAGYRAGSPPTN